jgi:hypothetical protein
MQLGRPVGVFRSPTWRSVLALATETLKYAGGAGVFIALLRTLLGLPALPQAWTTAKWILVGGSVLTAAGALHGLLLDRGIQVFEHGIRGTDFWGRSRELPWSRVRSARCTNVGGLRYLAVSSSAPEVELWIPTFLADRAGFCAALRAHAGPAHPLTREFPRAVP